jgi:uncharacterized RDD family membrane protein YckC
MDSHYGGFWRRFVAISIDLFILGTIGFTMLILGSVAFGLGVSPEDMAADPETLMELGAKVWAIYQALGFLLNMAYFTWFHGTTGQTPGKRLMGLRVVRDTGEAISFGTAFLRWVGYLISFLPLCMGFLWAGADRRKQAWHDKIAGTVVIDLYRVVEVEIPPKNALTNQGNLFT